MVKQCDSLRKMVQKISYKPIAASTGPLLGASSFRSSFFFFFCLILWCPGSAPVSPRLQGSTLALSSVLSIWAKTYTWTHSHDFSHACYFWAVQQRHSGSVLQILKGGGKEHLNHTFLFHLGHFRGLKPQMSSLFLTNRNNFQTFDKPDQILEVSRN